MKLVVTSTEDPASMNIRARLLEKPGWKESGAFEGHPVMTRDDFKMVQVVRIHLEEDNIDAKAAAALGDKVEVVIFASRHRSESKIPTLTVHPIGNFSSADLGGQPGVLCPTSPQLMTSALRQLSEHSEGLGFSVSFETTHHGPVVNSPAFYIEIGSFEDFWGREDAGQAVAESILECRNEAYPVIVCAGGGHYAPRFTEVALSKKVAIGHMAANYALSALSDTMIDQMVLKSSGARKVYFHKKGMPKQSYRELRERFASHGVQEISSDDLEAK